VMKFMGCSCITSFYKSVKKGCGLHIQFYLIYEHTLDNDSKNLQYGLLKDFLLNIQRWLLTEILSHSYFTSLLEKKLQKNNG
jgi:hypothetical protein